MQRLRALPRVRLRVWLRARRNARNSVLNERRRPAPRLRHALTGARRKLKANVPPNKTHATCAPCRRATPHSFPHQMRPVHSHAQTLPAAVLAALKGHRFAHVTSLICAVADMALYKGYENAQFLALCLRLLSARRARLRGRRQRTPGDWDPGHIWQQLSVTCVAWCVGSGTASITPCRYDSAAPHPQRLSAPETSSDRFMNSFEPPAARTSGAVKVDAPPGPAQMHRASERRHCAPIAGARQNGGKRCGVRRKHLPAHARAAALLAFSQQEARSVRAFYCPELSGAVTAATRL